MSFPPQTLGDPLNLEPRGYRTQADWDTPRSFQLTSKFAVRALPLWGRIPQIFNFLTSRSGFNEDLQEDELWQPVRPVGKGNFGVAALWRKENPYDDLSPEYTVVKEEPRATRNPENQSYKLMSEGHDRELYKEAWLMEQLNDRQCPNIIQLKGFKAQIPGEKVRFYFEFAPHGDLANLILRYRAWNRHMPEEFLWHCLRGLAEAQQVIVLNQWKDPATDEKDPVKDRFLIHFDLKPNNILLGDPNSPYEIPYPTFESIYPCPKMADFGEAELTSIQDASNPKALYDHGTYTYQAPVRL